MKKKKTKSLPGVSLIRKIADAAHDKKADDVEVLNLSSESGIADWFVICQGDNAMHNRAIADNIQFELDKLETKPWHTEGESDGRWIVMDYSDVVVHVMTPQVRTYYNLAELWTPVDIKEIDKRAVK
jgi:ribosome-associated protein